MFGLVYLGLHRLIAMHLDIHALIFILNNENPHDRVYRPNSTNISNLDMYNAWMQFVLVLLYLFIFILLIYQDID
jgi:hypothetical protein